MSIVVAHAVLSIKLRESTSRLVITINCRCFGRVDDAIAILINGANGRTQTAGVGEDRINQLWTLLTISIDASREEVWLGLNEAVDRIKDGIGDQIAKIGFLTTNLGLAAIEINIGVSQNFSILGVHNTTDSTDQIIDDILSTISRELGRISLNSAQCSAANAIGSNSGHRGGDITSLPLDTNTFLDRVLSGISDHHIILLGVNFSWCGKVNMQLADGLILALDREDISSFTLFVRGGEILLGLIIDRGICALVDEVLVRSTSKNNVDALQVLDQLLLKAAVLLQVRHQNHLVGIDAAVIVQSGVDHGLDDGGQLSHLVDKRLGTCQWVRGFAVVT